MVNCAQEVSAIMVEKMYTVEQVSEMLQVTAYTVRVWLKDGRLKGTKAGKLWRIRESDLDAFQRGNK